MTSRINYTRRLLLFLKQSQLIADDHTLYRAMQFVFTSDRRLCGIRAVLIAVQSILPLLSLYLLKLLVDSITDTAVSSGSTAFLQVWVYASLFSGVFLLTRVTNSCTGYNNQILWEKLIDYISGLLHDKSAGLDLAFYDN
ncbi:MAG: hypothetical protein D3922_11330, partial [Candidatus Electrothrix sp. AR1]|nr:hypothetical protein [Candidatus Electrothrix sp. AR1]